MSSSRKFHISPYKPVPARPSAGGKLMSNLSADSVGIFNYVTKRDWRRYLDREIRSEGYDYFWANTGIPVGQQPYPNFPSTSEPITLIHETRQPNGALAIVCGTPTTLYRYFALTNGLYYENDGTPNGYYAPSGPNLPYFNESPGTWIVIGSGFSPAAQRWEAEDLAGYTIFNNGVDLPVTYRVQDFQVFPIYEMREAGIASVGNISVSNDLLLCGNILQIGDGSSNVPVSSGNTTATLVNGTVTSSTSFFTPSSVGQIIQFLQGTSSVITGYVSSSRVMVEDTVDSISTGQTFTVQSPSPPSALSNLLSPINSGSVQAYQTGYTAGVISGTMAGGILTANSPAFFLGVAGANIYFSSGIGVTVVAYISPTQVSVSDATTIINPAQTFVTILGNQAYIVTALHPFFTTAMVGSQITFDNGVRRIITAFVDSENVVTDSYISVPGFHSFTVTNPAAYGPYSDPQNTTRIQWRMLNGVPGEPRRWSSSGMGNMTIGSALMTLAYPMKSFQELVGQEFIILGAGLNGGNLTAVLVAIDFGCQNLTFDTLALTTVTGTLVQAFDAVGSLVSFTDLQDDGSAIVAIKDLLGYLIVYKDTSIFIGQYAGQVGNVFNFTGQNKYAGSKSLYYRYTLIKVNSGGTDFHLYAGRNSFYRFDMITQEPNEVKLAENCKNIFFDNAGIPDPIGVELVPQGTFGLLPTLTIPLTPNLTYYYVPPTSGESLTNGSQVITSAQAFLAQGYFVTLTGVAGNPILSSLKLVNNVGVFSAENPITKEIFFCFPLGNGPDYALRFDYFNDQISSTSGIYTAAASVKRPVSGVETGPSEDWFLMGLPDGTVVRYGLTNSPPILSGVITASQSGALVTASNPIFTADMVTGRSIQWPDLTVNNIISYLSPTQVNVGTSQTRAVSSFSVISALWHRLGQPYASVLQCGLESFGTTFGEKDLEAIVVMLSSFSPNTQLLLEVLGTINPNSPPGGPIPVLGQKLFTNPQVQNAIGMLFRQNWFADRLTVNGINNPCELIERIYNIAGVNSKAFVQR